MDRMRSALRRPDVFDWLSFALIATVVALALSWWSKFPVHMDTGYHMAVTAGYARADGIALHSFWEFAPAGRAQLYPPLLHVIMYAFTRLGLSATTTARLVTFVAFPLLLLSGWYGMRKMFSSRSAFYTVVLLASCYLLFWHSAVESAASLVLILTPLIFVAVDRNRKVAAAMLLALALYSHLTLGHLVAFALLIYAIYRREMFKEIAIVLVGAYLLWLPWGIQILMHYKSLSFDQGGAGGMTVHLLIWVVALAGFVYCYFKKEKYYLLPSFLLGLVPMVFFYPDRFWNAHVFLPLAMLGGVALSGLHGYLGDKVRLAVKDRNVRRVFVTAMMAVPVVLFLLVDPVYASGGGMGGGPPGGTRQALQQQGLQAAAQPGTTQQQLPAQPPTGAPPSGGAPPALPQGAGGQAATGMQGGPPALGGAAPGQGGPGGSSGLHSTKTTIASLIGSSGAGQQSLGGSSLISADVLALSEFIEKNSTRDEIISVQDGSLGNLLTGLTGRPSTGGMFHEVAADSGGATGASSNAALLVVSRGGMGGGQAQADSYASAPGLALAGAPTAQATSSVDTSKYVLVGTAGSYTLYRSKSKGATAAVSGTVIPWYIVFSLLALALAAILIDWFRPPISDDSPDETRVAAPEPYNGGCWPRDPGEQNCVLVIVPCFNEEASIGRVVQELKRCAPFADVLVIDDGSSDRTGEAARAAGAMVLTHPRNQGVGAAMRSGGTYATGQGYLFAVQVDGDGQHDPRYIASLLRPLIGGAADVSIGSRFLGTDGYKPPFARRIGTMVLSSTISLATGRLTRDTTSGFRAMNRRALNFLIWTYPDEYPEPESLVLMHQNGLRWEEVPVVMRSRSNGASSIRGLGGGTRFMAGALSRIALDLLGTRPSPGPARV